ncbi:PrgI family protein [Enterococcus mundtii]|uniref:PrgI family protein n=1 Tax=Enterococcus mundtii TaxID=53346 RepID=UPI00189AAE36|nr:PrgI family protein [Enterococcus mundtii]MBO1085018.1 PrgI family protein [Enterococcus mundtii]MDV7743725.1 PrgI family protein [Enterococcus mundtii]
MAIEVVIRKEIKEYQEKIFFGFSLRQVIVIALALIVILPVGLVNHFIWSYSIDDLGIVLMFFTSPILSVGWIKKNQLPLEKYLLIRWRHLIATKHYPYQNARLEEDHEGISTRKISKTEKCRSEQGN